MTEARAQFPFRLKLTVAGGLLAFVPLLVVGALLLDVNADAVRTHARELQLAVADDLTSAIAQSFVQAQDLLDGAGRVLVGSEDEEHTERLALALVAGDELVDHVAVYDAEGELIDVLKEDGVRVVVPDILDAALRQQTNASNVATGSVGAGPRGLEVPVLVPLRVGERTTGFAMTMLSLDMLQARVSRLSEVRFEGRSGTLFVVDEHHRIIAADDPSSLLRVVSAGALEGIEPGTVTGRFQQSGEYLDGDRTMVGTVVGLEGRPWAVVVQQPTSIVYESLHRMRAIVIVTLAVVLLLALIVAFVVARQITRPISELAGLARDLAARRFDRRVTIQTRDELGVLGDVMSSAAAELQASEARIAEEIAIRADLGRYLPAEIVEAVVRREQDMGLGGKRKDITVLFADVVGFTPLTERLSAEEVVALLNELFSLLTEIVFRHGGTIDKFIGDCVMAMWGAPSEQPDHAARALAAAEDMIRWLEAGNAGWEERFGVKIQLAIGVHTGSAIVGNVGSETRMEFTAVGDTVNVAARLEAIARPMQILLSEETRVAAADDRFDLRPLGPRTLTGRARPVDLWELRP